MGTLALGYLIVLILGMTFGSMLAVYTLKFFRAPGGRVFFLHIAALTLGVVGDFQLTLSSSPEDAFFWERFRQSALTFAAPLLLVFAFQYQRAYRSREPRLSYLVMILPLATLAVLWGNQVVPWFFADWSVGKFEILTVLNIQYGPWFYAAGSLLYIALCVAYYFLASSLTMKRSPLLWILIGNVVGVISAGASVLADDALPLNPTAIGITLSLLFYAWGMQRSSLFNIMSAAHHTVFTSLQDAVFVLDDRDKLIQANDAGCDLLGARLSDLMYEPLIGFLSQQGYRGELPHETDARFELDLGNRVFDARFAPLRTENGYASGRLLALRDVTADKATQAALLESNQRYDTLVENIPAYLYQLRQTPNGAFKLDYVSPRICTYLQLEPDVITADPTVIFGFLDPDSVSAMVDGQMLSARDLTPLIWEGKLTIQGQMRWARAESTPRRLSDGTTIWNGIANDITARKEAELALERSQKLIERIAQILPDVLQIHDVVYNKLTYANRDVGHLTGYSGDEMRAMKPGFAEVLIHPEDYARERLLRGRYTHLSDDEIVESEYRWKHKDGGYVWLNTRKMVYERAADGQVSQILSVSRDVTDRKEAEEERQQLLVQLQKANQQLSDFAYVISHDLKAPLRGVSSVAEWLGSGYEDKFDAEGRELIQLLRGRVRRMQDMINGVLEYSRIGRELETSIPIALDSLVRQIIQDIAPADRIRVTIEDELPTLFIEPTRVRQIFQNLIDNAVKFMDKPDGEIRIGCTNDGEMWRFAIRDNGPGIDAHHFERIFQIFHTLAPTDPLGSTGIGLTIARRIVEVYNGRIWLESSPGQGTTFFFTLPTFLTAASGHPWQAGRPGTTEQP